MVSCDIVAANKFLLLSLVMSLRVVIIGDRAALQRQEIGRNGKETWVSLSAAKSRGLKPNIHNLTSAKPADHGLYVGPILARYDGRVYQLVSNGVVAHSDTVLGETVPIVVGKSLAIDYASKSDRHPTVSQVDTASEHLNQRRPARSTV